MDNWLWLAAIILLGGLGFVALARQLPAGALLLACYSRAEAARRNGAIALSGVARR